VGGTGLVGGHLAEYFFKEGEISKGIFRKGSHLRIMDQCGVQCIEADLMDRHTLHEPLDMVDVVYNLACPPPTASEEEQARFVDVGVRNLLEEANEHGAKSFVHLSCLDVYGSGGAIDAGARPVPKDRYQKAKLNSEDMVMAFGRNNPDMKVRVVRAAMAVGPRDTKLTVPLLKMIERGKAVLPSGSSSSISLIHPKDIAQALLKAASCTGGDIGIPLVKSFDASVEDVCREMTRVTGTNVQVGTAGLFSGGKTSIPPYTIDRIKARRTLGNREDLWAKIQYAPNYTLAKTVEEVAEWHRKEPWSTKDIG
jgi:nucleoside-diphosphate-sugar epimerase